MEPHLLQERMSTMGRFGGKITGEIDLYLKEKQRQLLQFPEREVGQRVGKCRLGCAAAHLGPNLQATTSVTHS